MYEMISRSNLIQFSIPTKAFAQNFVKAPFGVGVAFMKDWRWGMSEARGERREA
jgi:hypothetical protein